MLGFLFPEAERQQRQENYVQNSTLNLLMNILNQLLLDYWDFFFHKIFNVNGLIIYTEKEFLLLYF